MKTLALTTIISAIIIGVIIILAVIPTKPTQPGVYDYVITDYTPDTNKTWGTNIIQNQTFHFVDENTSETSHKPTSLIWYDTNFTFPNGLEPEITPGGGIFEAYVTFPNETVPYRMAVGLGHNTDHKTITVLSIHKDPQVGYAIYGNTIRLLVNWPKVHSDLVIKGFNDTYKTSQLIDFQIEAKGFDYFDAGEIPDIMITKPDGTFSWENQKFDVSCCPAELGNYDRTFNFTSLGGPITIEKTGLYNLMISYNRQEIHKQFSVKEDEGVSFLKNSNLPVLIAGVVNSNLTVSYTVDGAKLSELKNNKQFGALEIYLQTTSDGILTIDLPRKLIDAKISSGEDDTFFVLADGQEILYTEMHKTANERILSIPFKNGVQKIEIIATQVI